MVMTISEMTALGSRKVGSRRFMHGTTYEWTGSGWKPLHPEQRHFTVVRKVKGVETEKATLERLLGIEAGSGLSLRALRKRAVEAGGVQESKESEGAETGGTVLKGDYTIVAGDWYGAIKDQKTSKIIGYAGPRGTIMDIRGKPIGTYKAAGDKGRRVEVRLGGPELGDKGKAAVKYARDLIDAGEKWAEEHPGRKDHIPWPSIAEQLGVPAGLDKSDVAFLTAGVGLRGKTVYEYSKDRGVCIKTGEKEYVLPWGTIDFIEHADRVNVYTLETNRGPKIYWAASGDQAKREAERAGLKVSDIKFDGTRILTEGQKNEILRTAKTRGKESFLEALAKTGLESPETIEQIFALKEADPQAFEAFLKGPKAYEKYMEREHIKIPNSDIWMPKAYIEDLKERYPEAYDTLMTEGYDAYQDLFIAVGAGEVIFAKDFGALPKEYQDIVMKEGISGLSAYIERGEVPMGSTVKELDKKIDDFIKDPKKAQTGGSLRNAIERAGLKPPLVLSETYLRGLSQEDKEKIAAVYVAPEYLEQIQAASWAKVFQKWQEPEQKAMTVKDIDSIIKSRSPLKDPQQELIAIAIMNTPAVLEDNPDLLILWQKGNYNKVNEQWDKFTPGQKEAVLANYKDNSEEIINQIESFEQSVSSWFEGLEKDPSTWQGKALSLPMGVLEVAVMGTLGIGGAVLKAEASLKGSKPKTSVVHLSNIPLGMAEWAYVQVPERIEQDPVSGGLRLIGNLALPFVLKGVKGTVSKGAGVISTVKRGGILPRALKGGGMDVYRVNVPEGFERLSSELEIIARDKAQMDAIFKSGLTKDQQVASVRELLNPETRKVYDAYLETIGEVAKFKVPDEMIRQVDFADVTRIPEESAPALKTWVQEHAGDIRVHGSFADWVQTKGIKGMWRPNDLDIHISPKSSLTPEAAAKELAGIIKKTSGVKARAVGGAVEVFINGKWIKAVDVHTAGIFGKMPYEWQPKKAIKIEGIPFESLAEQAFHRGKEIIRPGVGAKGKGLMGPEASQYSWRLKDVYRFHTETRGIADILRKQGKNKMADKLDSNLDFVEKAPRGKPSPLTAEKGAALQKEFIDLVGELQEASLKRGVDVSLEHRLGTLTRFVSPAGRVMTGTLYSATRDIRPYIQAAKRGYIEPGWLIDESGKIAKAPRQVIFTSPDLAFDFLYDLGKGKIPQDAGVIAIRVTPENIGPGKAVRTAFRVEYETLPGGKTYPVVLDELVLADRIYPTDPTGMSLRKGAVSEGVTGESLTYHPRTNKPVHILWFATEEARKAGLGAPTDAQIRSMNWMAVKATLADLGHPHLPKRIIATTEPIKGGGLIEFYRDTYKWKGKPKADVARAVAEQDKKFTQEAVENLKGRKFDSPEKYAEALNEEMGKVYARKVLEAFSDKEIQKLISEISPEDFRSAYVINLKELVSKVAVAGLGGSGTKTIEDLKSSDITTLPASASSLKVRETTLPSSISSKIRSSTTPRITTPKSTTTPSVSATSKLTSTVPRVVTQEIITTPVATTTTTTTAPTTVPKKITEIRRGNFEVKEAEGIPENPGIVSWRQGLYWISVMPPYREGNIDIVYSKEPPPVAKIRRGKPKKTVYTWRGRPPEHLKVDIGAFDASVKRGKLIKFERDINGETRKQKLLPGTISRRRRSRYNRPAFIF